jgi:hypothetical protein
MKIAAPKITSTDVGNGHKRITADFGVGSDASCEINFSAAKDSRIPCEVKLSSGEYTFRALIDIPVDDVRSVAEKAGAAVAGAKKAIAAGNSRPAPKPGAVKPKRK